jgi:hypothetical protein
VPPLQLSLGDQHVVGQFVEVRQLSALLPAGTHDLEPAVLPSTDDDVFENSTGSHALPVRGLPL